MESIETFKKMIAQYYENDAHAEEKKDYDKESPELSEKLLVRLPEVEKKLSLLFPEKYVSFIKAQGVFGYNTEQGDNFYCYGENDLYEFNYAKKNKGYSAFKELQGYIVFGQDDGELSYFFDPNNLLGYGKEAVYRVNRGELEKEYIEFLAEDFMSFFSFFVENKNVPQERPFYKEPEVPVLEEGCAVLKRIHEEVSKDGEVYTKVQSDIGKIKEYIKTLHAKHHDGDDDFAHEYGYNMGDAYFNVVNKLEAHYKRSLPIEYLCLLETLRGGFYQSPNIFISFFAWDGLESYNIEMNSNNKILKNCLMFAKQNSEDVFFIFLDMNNVIGNGTSAIYMIPYGSKKISEACYIAKDFVDLFRMIAENEELNTIPIDAIIR